MTKQAGMRGVGLSVLRGEKRGGERSEAIRIAFGRSHGMRRFRQLKLDGGDASDRERAPWACDMGMGRRDARRDGKRDEMRDG